MKTISIIQPWASLVVLGAKKYETRSWPTSYRGRILIHASMKKTPEFANLCNTDHFRKFINGPLAYSGLPYGAIIGEAFIDACGPTEVIRGKLSAQELTFGNYATGRYAWRLVNPIKYKKPYLFPGTMGLWNFDERLLTKFK